MGVMTRPFLRSLFLEGLLFGGAYLRRELCVSKPIGLAIYLEVNLPFLLCFTLYLRAIFRVQAPPGGGGAYMWRGLFSEFYGTYLLGWRLLSTIVSTEREKKEREHLKKYKPHFVEAKHELSFLRNHYHVVNKIIDAIKKIIILYSYGVFQGQRNK